MGDHGKLYHGFTPELVQGIRELATHADVITPNLTEAALLLGEEPNTAPLSLGQARTAFGPGAAGSGYHRGSAYHRGICQPVL